MYRKILVLAVLVMGLSFTVSAKEYSYSFDSGDSEFLYGEKINVEISCQQERSFCALDFDDSISFEACGETVFEKSGFSPKQSLPYKITVDTNDVPCNPGSHEFKSTYTERNTFSEDETFEDSGGSFNILENDPLKSYTYNVSGEEFRYGDKFTVKASCVGDPDEECSLDDTDSVSFRVCGEKVFSRSGSRLGQSLPYTFKVDTVADSCSVGGNLFTSEYREPSGTTRGAGGEFTLREKGSMNPNRGHFLYAEWENTGSSTKLDNFFLSNEHWYDSATSGGFDEFPDRSSGDPLNDGGAYFYISDKDRQLSPDKDDHFIFYSEYGATIDLGGKGLAEAASGLEERELYRRDPLKGNSPSEEESIELLKKGFQQGYQYGYDPACDLSKGETRFVADSCSPAHTNGTYLPDGSMIGATPLDRDRPEVDEDRNRPSEWKDSQFFICRDAPGAPWTGVDPEKAPVSPSSDSASKVVRVKDRDSGLWNYYRCGEDGEWQEVNCPDSLESYRYSDGEYGCIGPGPSPEPSPSPEPTPPEDPGAPGQSTFMLEAKFLELSGVTKSSLEAGYIAGFKIPANTLDRFRYLHGYPIKTIDAVCWMGEDDERPFVKDKEARFSVNIAAQQTGDQTDPAWVLDRLPVRTGVDRTTYSCIFGAKNTDQDIYEGTSPDPNKDETNYMGLKDNGSIEVSYDVVQDLHKQEVSAPNTAEIKDAGQSGSEPFSNYGGKENPLATPYNEAPYSDSETSSTLEALLGGVFG